MKQTKLFTGNVFFCLGIKDEDEEFLLDSFFIGKTYFEVRKDIDGMNQCNCDEILLATDEGLPMYVKRDDFALMPEATEKLKADLKNEVNK